MGTTHPKIQGRGKASQSMTIDLELLESLGIKASDSDDGMTIKEMVEVSDMCINKIRDLIRGGVRSGTIEIGRRWVAPDWDGKNRSYTVYSMKED